ncbi:MAG: F0F1 ATP synthase subunit delta [Propionibacteriaceae bacterium]|jgi:F-type H+-transporting ATPase subunit delta|nr:F0F1 ATP synthase subunit delta [Propionibacteriaceae bacterium]
MSRDRTLFSQLAAAGDEVSATIELADDVLAVAGVLDAESALQRRLTDPTIEPSGRAELAEAVFGTRVSKQAVGILQAAARLPFTNGGDFADAVHDSGIRLLWRAAEAKDEFVATRDALNVLVEAVASSTDLNAALGDESYDLASREALVSGLLGARAGVFAPRLATEAVRHNRRGYAHELNHYLDVAEGLRARLNATISTAIQISPEQSAQLISELTRIYGVPVDAVFKIEHDVVGGVRVDVADEVIDGTIVTKMHDVENKLG